MRKQVSFRVVLFNLLLIVIGMEVLLRSSLFPYLKTWQEKQGRHYISPFKMQEQGYYHVSHYPGKCFGETTEGREYEFCYNMMGLRDREHSLKKAPQVKRVIAMGDSFTEGIGAPVDSTWSALLSNKLNSDSGMRYEIFNAGFRGADILFNSVLLQNRLAGYSPDLVIIELNSTDLYEMAIRGGMERFKTDSTVVYRVKGPWWEPVFEYSYLARALVYIFVSKDFMFKFFTSPLEYASYLRYGNQQICIAINALQHYCTERHIELAIFIHPLYYELEKNEKPLATVGAYCDSLGIECIDLFEPFQMAYNENRDEVTNQYFYKIDMHNKPVGNLFIANQVYKALSALQKKDSLPS